MKPAFHDFALFTLHFLASFLAHLVADRLPKIVKAVKNLLGRLRALFSRRTAGGNPPVVLPAPTARKRVDRSEKSEK